MGKKEKEKAWKKSDGKRERDRRRRRAKQMQTKTKTRLIIRERARLTNLSVELSNAFRSLPLIPLSLCFTLLSTGRWRQRQISH